jgi:sugar phosphate isomerase/epimerase
MLWPNGFGNGYVEAAPRSDMEPSLTSIGPETSRRGFLKRGALLAATAGAAPWVRAAGATAMPPRSAKFDISMAAWSVHRMVQAGRLKQIDMPELCRKQLDLGGLELVNSFFPSPQYGYLLDLKKRAADHGVKILLIMCDGEGDLGHADKPARMLAARNHRKWVDVAAVLGCHSIRCNSGGSPGDADAIERCAESFAALVEYAGPDGINIIVENHGGLSADPDAMIEVIRKVNDPRFGTLPDFGNFPPRVDRYEAVRKWMPYARAVSAKCYEFDEAGNEKRTDYMKMMRIVAEAGYAGFVGIEYEGPDDDEIAGILKCKRLLERCREEL